MPRPLLIALLAALLIHAFLIFGVHYELPRSGQPGRKTISMTLVRPNPPKLAEATPETPPAEPVQTPLPSEVAPSPRQEAPPEIKAETKPPEKPLAPGKPATRKAREQGATSTEPPLSALVGPPRPEPPLSFLGPPKPATSNAFVGPPNPMPNALEPTQKRWVANQDKPHQSAVPNPAGEILAKTEPPAQARMPVRPARTKAEQSLPWDDEEEEQSDEDEDEPEPSLGENNRADADLGQPPSTFPNPKPIVQPEPSPPNRPAPPMRPPEPQQQSAHAASPMPAVEAGHASIPGRSRTVGSPDSPLPQTRQTPAEATPTPPKPIETIQAKAPKPEPTPAQSQTHVDVEPFATSKTARTRKSGDQQERRTGRKTDPAPAPQNDGKGDKTGKPAFSASLLSQQIAEVSADIYKQRSVEMRDKKIVYATEVKSHRVVVAAYEQAWQEKVERIGNLNYPDEARRNKLSGTLTLAVGIKPDGSVYSVQLHQPSGHGALDNAARNIVHLAAPFAPLPKEIRDEVDILVITRTWRFDSNYHLETRVR